MWEKQESGSYWKPAAEGEEIIGTVKAIDEAAQFGTQYIIVKDKDKEEITTPAHTVLINKMAKAKLGDHVRIVYTGEGVKQGKNRSPAQLYDVYIERADAVAKEAK
jgi:hypothetical protein